MLELKNISFAVENKNILQNINLRVDKNKFIVITGPNGSGKSTLAKMITGIYAPTGGSIYLNGQDITAMPIDQRAQNGIAFAFQQPVRFKGLSTRDLINLAAGGKLNEKQICGYLYQVGLCARDYLYREVNASLSGGEIKRIEIATVLARKAQLTIFDEPEAGIDLWSFNNLISIFKKLRKENEGTVMIISHQERILEIADEIILLANGKIVKQGKQKDLLPNILSKGKCTFCAKREESI